MTLITLKDLATEDRVKNKDLPLYENTVEYMSQHRPQDFGELTRAVASAMDAKQGYLPILRTNRATMVTIVSFVGRDKQKYIAVRDRSVSGDKFEVRDGNNNLKIPVASIGGIYGIGGAGFTKLDHVRIYKDSGEDRFLVNHKPIACATEGAFSIRDKALQAQVPDVVRVGQVPS